MQARAVHQAIASRQPVVRSGRATICAAVLRAGLWLCLIVIGSLIGVLAASLPADPTARALLVAGVGATALALVLLVVFRLAQCLTAAMRLAEEAAGRIATDPMPAAAGTGFAELDAVLAKAGAVRADRDAAAEGAKTAGLAVLKRREEELSDRIARLNAALDTLSLGFLLYDRDHRLLVVNRRYHEIYQLPPGAVTPGMPASEVLRRNVQSGNLPDRSESEQLAEIGALIRSDAVPTQIQHLADGRVVAVEIRPIDGGGFVAIYEEATRALERRGPHRPHGSARCRDRPSQSRPAARADRRGDHSGTARHRFRRALSRPRQLQAGQRHPRPRGGRRVAAGRWRTASGPACARSIPSPASAATSLPSSRPRSGNRRMPRPWLSASSTW
jgi:PAS domain-containing protein